MEYRITYEEMDLAKFMTSDSCSMGEDFSQKKKEMCQQISIPKCKSPSENLHKQKKIQNNIDEISDIEIIFENVVAQPPKMENINTERTPSPLPIKNIFDTCNNNPLKAVRRLKFDSNDGETSQMDNNSLNVNVQKLKRKCKENFTAFKKIQILSSGLDENVATHSEEKLLEESSKCDEAEKDYIIYSVGNSFNEKSQFSNLSQITGANCDVLKYGTKEKDSHSPIKRLKSNFAPRKNVQTLKRTGVYQNLSQISSDMLNVNKSFRGSKSVNVQYSQTNVSGSQSCNFSQNSFSNQAFMETDNISSSVSLSQKSETLSDSSDKQCSQNLLQATVNPHPGEKQSFSNKNNNNVNNNNNTLWKSKYRNEQGIYLENLLRIIKAITLSSKDWELFNNHEQQLILNFTELSLANQKLYLRLLLRKIGWIRKAKLDYPEICNINDVDAIIDELSSNNFILKETHMELSEILAVLTLPEIKQLSRDVEVKRSGNKNDIMKRLINHSTTSVDNSDIHERALVILGSCCKLNVGVYKLFMRILILYYLPRFQCDDEGGPQADLPTLLTLNMKNMKFPNYQLIRDQDIFRSRNDLIRLEKVKELDSNIRESMENKEWKKAFDYCKEAEDLYKKSVEDEELSNYERSLPSYLRVFTATSALVFILNLRVDILQALRKYQAAMNQLHELLTQTSHLQDFRGHWYNRLALNLHHHLNKPDQALLIIHVALYEQEVSSAHKLSLSQRALRIGQQNLHFKPELNEMPLQHLWVIPSNTIKGKSLERTKIGHKRKFLSTDANQKECFVEQYAKENYRKKGYPEGLHGESIIANSLFGLLFWDIIYASVPDAFRSKDQVAPLDLDTPYFYASRKALIESRLSSMYTWDEGMIRKELETVWEEHVGQHSLVAWGLLRNLHYLKGLVLSLGISVVAAICERLAKDHRFSKTGFPDLIVWNPHKKIHRIVEVKGPGDVLSSNQSIWMDYLIDSNAAVEVCHVIDSSQKLAKGKKKPVSIKQKDEKTFHRRNKD
ncbi:unnamed protein product [Meganyctiphanes norvegica]|uniref:Fanconi-associated nuclease n=1 Tax=Meganyctiphanes norvegica TaxID=48144 RepID=A0AAV2RQT8_MEGNR